MLLRLIVLLILFDSSYQRSQQCLFVPTKDEIGFQLERYDETVYITVLLLLLITVL
jgi:hypothetical protein